MLLRCNQGDLVRCIDYMRSLSLYDSPNSACVRQHVGELHCDDLALVVAIIDLGTHVSNMMRYKCLLLVSEPMNMGWCEFSNFLCKA